MIPYSSNDLKQIKIIHKIFKNSTSFTFFKILQILISIGLSNKISHSPSKHFSIFMMRKKNLEENRSIFFIKNLIFFLSIYYLLNSTVSRLNFVLTLHPKQINPLRGDFILKFFFAHSSKFVIQ